MNNDQFSSLVKCVEFTGVEGRISDREKNDLLAALYDAYILSKANASMTNLLLNDTHVAISVAKEREEKLVLTAFKFAEDLLYSTNIIYVFKLLYEQAGLEELK